MAKAKHERRADTEAPRSPGQVLVEVMKPTTDDSGAMTTKELMAETGRGESWVCRALRELDAQGRLRIVRVPRRCLGFTQMVQAYVILPEK